MSSIETLRVGIVKRVLTIYRRPFFERLASQPNLEVSVFAGQPQRGEAVQVENTLDKGKVFPATNHHWQSPAGLLCWQSGLRDWLRSYDPQVLVMEASPRMLSHWFAIDWMHRRRRPVLGWGLGELERSGPIWFQKVRQAFAWRLIRSFDAMIAYSSKAKNDYIAAGVPEDGVFIAYNSIDNSESEMYLAKLGGRMDWVRPWKESLNLLPDLPIILFVGRLIPQKRVDLLIRACSPLFDHCQLLIVGDGPLRVELENQAKPFGNKVCFVGHQVGEMLARCFIGSDIFVLPGAGGLAMHQAMSYGKPVIVSFGDGTEADLARDGQNGYFFRLGSEEDLRAKIELLLHSPDRIRQFGQVSLTLIQSEINLDAMVRSFLQAFDYVKHCYQ